jgi:hypothetical protein
MTFGVSSALHEEALVEPRTGAFLNHDLAGYLVPVHADIHEIEAVLLDGFDDKANVRGPRAWVSWATAAPTRRWLHRGLGMERASEPASQAGMVRLPPT